ncbi:periplasmic nitrate reductase, NapE protein [Muricoccus pecuniae]|uniref:periplasmic nitrate reductase, NapE protein n=1 Tax=Muricoccus pecuniae TaxID=693023 RepID=UPI0028B1A912|nr:periplasmic nitrate reductase, NapE protein [Roseomonas pecuniae]
MNSPPDAQARSAASNLPIGSRGRLEAVAFAILAVLIWPIIAVGVVAGWGFLVWMYYLFTGPPGPV